MGALNRVKKNNPQDSTLFILKDAYPFLNPSLASNISNIRQLRNLAGSLQVSRSKQALISPSMNHFVPRPFCVTSRRAV